MSQTQRPLTEAENAELEALNAAVSSAIEARRKWLDAKMHETSHLKVGDDIYDLDTGFKLGTVSKLYRYWEDRDEGVRDTSVGCDYEYEKYPRCFDNTSRQLGLSYGTKDDAIRHAEMRTERLRAGG